MVLTGSEREQIFKIAEKLTGVSQEEEFRRDVLVSNVQRRMSVLGYNSFAEYFKFVDAEKSELAFLISALTIHTTSWFREKPHYSGLEKRFRAFNPLELQNKKFRLISTACSTGEEVYSFALLLEKFRGEIQGFDYEIVGLDVDPISVHTAQRGVYSTELVKQIPDEYQEYVLYGEGRATGYFTLSKEIKQRCQFRVHNLMMPPLPEDIHQFDQVVCRNVLIYFSPANVDKIIRHIMKYMTSTGTLVLGHSEAITGKDFALKGLGNSTYMNVAIENNVIPANLSTRTSTKDKPQVTIKTSTLTSGKVATLSSNNRSHSPVLPSATPATASISVKNGRRYKILVVDDSPTVRQMLGKLIEKSGMESHLCKGADETSAFLEHSSVDLITLDLNMPGKDGKTWLLEQRSTGLLTPVVIVSGAEQNEAKEVIRALGEGAQDYIDKGEFTTKSENIGARLRAIIEAFVRRKDQSLSQIKRNSISANLLRKPDLILVGASTGGTEALTKVFRSMPGKMPPLCVVQHISPAFAKIFAERLAQVSGLELAGDAELGRPLKSGFLYMALDDYHIGLVQRDGKVFFERYDIAQIHGHRPSVDKLFQSAVGFRQVNILSILLTGMGRDGARGMTTLKSDGAFTVAQDEASCVIFGMPKEAIRMGGATFVGNLDEIRDLVIRSLAHRAA